MTDETMDQPINKSDEFLLSRLLDGDLGPDETAALRGRMEREPALRETFESLARVDGLVKRRHADQPEVDWRRFREELPSGQRQALDGLLDGLTATDAVHRYGHDMQKVRADRKRLRRRWAAFALARKYREAADLR